MAGKIALFYYLIPCYINRDVNRAADEYYSKGYGETFSTQSFSGSGGNAAKIQQTFDKYKDASTGNIEVEGLQKFFEDLGVNPGSDTVTILISSKMKAADMGTYKLQEFKDGFTAMGVSTTDELKRKLPSLY